MTTTTQISVRLPAELVDWLDAEVSAGHAASKAAMIARVLRKTIRRQRAEREAARRLATPPDPDEDARVDWMHTRDWPEMGEPARILNPELVAERARREHDDIIRRLAHADPPLTAEQQDHIVALLNDAWTAEAKRQAAG